MSIYIYMYISTVCLSTYLCGHPSVYTYTYLHTGPIQVLDYLPMGLHVSNHLSVDVSGYLSVCASIDPTIFYRCMRALIYLSIILRPYVPVCPCTCLSIYLSIYVPIDRSVYLHIYLSFHPSSIHKCAGVYIYINISMYIYLYMYTVAYQQLCRNLYYASVARLG